MVSRVKECLYCLYRMNMSPDKKPYSDVVVNPQGTLVVEDSTYYVEILGVIDWMGCPFLWSDDKSHKRRRS